MMAVLEELHISHPCMVHMKLPARLHFWWLGCKSSYCSLKVHYKHPSWKALAGDCSTS